MRTRRALRAQLTESTARRRSRVQLSQGHPMSKDQVLFYKIPDAPASVGAGGIIGPLVDSIGSRFRSAVEGLVDADLAYKNRGLHDPRRADPSHP